MGVLCNLGARQSCGVQCLHWSELFWWHEEDLYDIRQVILMLIVISVLTYSRNPYDTE